MSDLTTFFDRRGIDGADRVPKQVLKKAQQIIHRLDGRWCMKPRQNRA